MLPLAGVIDLAVERARLAKERDKARARRGRSRTSSATPISSPGAKEEVVEENRERLAISGPRSRGWRRRWRGSPAETGTRKSKGRERR